MFRTIMRRVVEETIRMSTGRGVDYSQRRFGRGLLVMVYNGIFIFERTKDLAYWDVLDFRSKSLEFVSRNAYHCRNHS